MRGAKAGIEASLEICREGSGEERTEEK